MTPRGGVRQIRAVANDPLVVNLIERLMKVPPAAEALRNSRALAAVREFFDRKRAQFGDVGCFAVTAGGTTIGSMRDENLGSENIILQQRGELLARVFAGETVLIPPLFSDVAMQVSWAEARRLEKLVDEFEFEDALTVVAKLARQFELRLD